MMTFMKKLWRDKRGNALIIAAGALPLVIGSAGLASDTIQWVTWKRYLQRAADSAAFAGVYAEMQSQAVAGAVTTDLATNNQSGIALLSGFPQIAYPTGTAGTNAVRVTLAVQKRLGFSSVFMADPPVITATATAAIVPTGNYCVVSLENTATTGIDATGNATVDLGCGMITNSTSLTAAVATGSSDVHASPIAAVGGISSSNNWDPSTTFLPFTIAQEDPFGTVNPTMPTGPCANDPNIGPQDVRTDLTGATATTSDDALSPGCYNKLTVKGDLKLKPGVYFINGGDISINSGAKLSGEGVTLVLSNSSSSAGATIGTADLNGGATINLVAPDAGPYAGIAIYQDRRATNTNGGNKINGNSTSHFQGAFYFPSQEVEFLGNAGMNTVCMQLVARRVKFSGNANIVNQCPPGSGSGSFQGRHVRLVA